MKIEHCTTCNGKGWLYVETPIGAEKITCDDCGGKEH